VVGRGKPTEAMAYYFKRDDNARRDPKMSRLRRVKGMKGIGIYWCLIEIMHEQGGEISMEEITSIAFELQEDEINIKSVLLEFDLFVIHPYGFGNTRVLQSLEEREKKSKNGKKAVNSRWKNKKPENQQDDTDVLPKTYVRNTIREEKIIEDNTLKDKSLDSLIKFYQDSILKDQISMSILCKNNRLKMEDLPKLVATFVEYKRQLGEITEPPHEVRNHFIRWVPLRKDKGISNDLDNPIKSDFLKRHGIG